MRSGTEYEIERQDAEVMTQMSPMPRLSRLPLVAWWMIPYLRFSELHNRFGIGGGALMTPLMFQLFFNWSGSAWKNESLKKHMATKLNMGKKL